MPLIIEKAYTPPTTTVTIESVMSQLLDMKLVTVRDETSEDLVLQHHGVPIVRIYAENWKEARRKNLIVVP